MADGLEGKVAIVTGRGRGRRLRRRHGCLVDGGRGRRRGRPRAGRRSSRRSVVAIEGDASLTAETAERAVATALERFGRLDILVNNAGHIVYKTILDTSDEEWDRVMAVNVRSMFVHCRAAIPVHAGAGRRSDRQHGLDLGSDRDPRPDRLHGEQGGGRAADEAARRGVGAGRDPGQRRRARSDRHPVPDRLHRRAGGPGGRRRRDRGPASAGPLGHGGREWPSRSSSSPPTRPASSPAPCWRSTAGSRRSSRPRTHADCSPTPSRLTVVTANAARRGRAR